MAVKGNNQMFTGLKGLITEASPTNFPADACTDLLNVELGLDGSVATRPGLIGETGGAEVTSTTDQTGAQMDNYPASLLQDYARQNLKWDNAGGVRGINLEVVRIGLRLFIFQHGTTISTQCLGGVNLEKVEGLITNIEYAQTAPFESASGNGRLYIANPGVNPFAIEISSSFDSFTVSYQPIIIRDMEGVEETLDNDARPGYLTEAHLYNLRNQGWPTTSQDCSRDREGDGIVSRVPHTYVKQVLGVYPSNADIFWMAIQSTAAEPEAVGSFSPWELKKIGHYNTPAPKGHFKYNAFDWRSNYPNFRRKTVARPSALCFFSGRLFYAGISTDLYANTVFFSQAGSALSKIGKCYQEADPTAEEVNDLVDTDGGTLRIQNMEGVVALRTLGTFLVLFADNGVWSISGVDGGTFSATNASVQKISSNGCISATSIVEADNALYYFGKSGIHRIAVTDGVGISLAEQSITETSIKSHYQSMGAQSLLSAGGKYSRKESKIYWLLKGENVVDPFDYGRYLILDLRTGAWTRWASEQPPEVRLHSGVPIEQFALTAGGEEQVTDDLGDPVSLNDDNTIITVEGARRTTDVAGDPKIKVCATVDNGTSPAGIIFGEFTSIDYVDWIDKVTDGIPYNHYFELGFNAMGANARRGSAVYVNSFFSRDITVRGVYVAPPLPYFPFNPVWHEVDPQPELPKFVKVRTDEWCSGMALDEDGEYWVCGHNYYGQLPSIELNAFAYKWTKIPYPLPGGRIADDFGTESGVNWWKVGGTIYAIGNNTNGAMADGTLENWHTVKAIDTPGAVDDFCIYGGGSIVLCNGVPYTSGHNSSGRLANYTPLSDTTPRPYWNQCVAQNLEYISGVKQLSSGGGSHAIVLQSGEVFTAGSGTTGQLGLPEVLRANVFYTTGQYADRVKHCGTGLYLITGGNATYCGWVGNDERGAYDGEFKPDYELSAILKRSTGLGNMWADIGVIGLITDPSDDNALYCRTDGQRGGGYRFDKWGWPQPFYDWIPLGIRGVRDVAYTTIVDKHGNILHSGSNWRGSGGLGDDRTREVHQWSRVLIDGYDLPPIDGRFHRVTGDGKADGFELNQYCQIADPIVLKPGEHMDIVFSVEIDRRYQGGDEVETWYYEQGIILKSINVGVDGSCENYIFATLVEEEVGEQFTYRYKEFMPLTCTNPELSLDMTEIPLQEQIALRVTNNSSTDQSFDCFGTDSTYGGGTYLKFDGVAANVTPFGYDRWVDLSFDWHREIITPIDYSKYDV